MYRFPRIRRRLIHHFLQSQKTAYSKEEYLRKLSSLKKEEKKAALELGYAVYAKGDAGKYGRTGADLLSIEDDLATVESRYYDKKRILKKND